jgi:hypothetical protein
MSSFPFSISFPKLFSTTGLANQLLDNIKPALRALIADSVARVPDYIPADDARPQVLDAVARAIDHSLGHNPALALARSLLLVAVRQIVEGIDPRISVAALKARVVDQMIIRINSVRV